jgi:hypothetical protein
VLFVIWLPLILQVVVPSALLAWLALGRPASRMAWVLRVLLSAGYILGIAMAGLWLILPWYTPFFYYGLLLPAIACSRRRLRGLPLWPVGRPGLLAVALPAVVIGGLGAIMVSLVMARRAPSEAVDLAFPLRGGTYLVVNGGGSTLINAHLKTLQGERFRPWRGQSHGVDIEKLDGLGLRADGVLPRELGAYRIFGEPVHAPCAGNVVAALDGIPEMVPPQMDREHMAGNHVILECGHAWILLGHLQRGSVRVRAGDRLAAGRVIGRVGNTGNTGEPHLHVHAQRAGTAADPLSGEPLPIRFGARYPVRNQRFAVP